jgi:NitT/TauT family transport system substrate-binding protein
MLCRIWGNYNHEVDLDQNLIVRLEVLTRWLMENSGTAPGALPNFLDYIYVDGLKAADPAKVTIVHRANP